MRKKTCDLPDISQKRQYFEIFPDKKSVGLLVDKKDFYWIDCQTREAKKISLTLPDESKDEVQFVDVESEDDKREDESKDFIFAPVSSEPLRVIFPGNKKNYWLAEYHSQKQQFEFLEPINVGTFGSYPMIHCGISALGEWRVQYHNPKHYDSDYLRVDFYYQNGVVGAHHTNSDNLNLICLPAIQAVCFPWGSQLKVFAPYSVSHEEKADAVERSKVLLVGDDLRERGFDRLRAVDSHSVLSWGSGSYGTNHDTLMFCVFPKAKPKAMQVIVQNAATSNVEYKFFKPTPVVRFDPGPMNTLRDVQEELTKCYFVVNKIWGSNYTHLNESDVAGGICHPIARFMRLSICPSPAKTDWPHDEPLPPEQFNFAYFQEIVLATIKIMYTNRKNAVEYGHKVIAPRLFEQLNLKKIIDRGEELIKLMPKEQPAPPELKEAEPEPELEPEPEKNTRCVMM